MITASLLVAIGLATWEACTLVFTKTDHVLTAKLPEGLVARCPAPWPTWIARGGMLLVAFGCARALAQIGGP